MRRGLKRYELEVRECLVGGCFKPIPDEEGTETLVRNSACPVRRD